jgi:ubiquitin-activating enzyme E1
LLHYLHVQDSNDPIQTSEIPQAHSFEVEEDTRGFGRYEKGGLVTQVKEKKTLYFRELSEALAEPGDFPMSDFAKLERPAILHLGFQALDHFKVGQFHLKHPVPYG